jgi:hypothetical protein
VVDRLNSPGVVASVGQRVAAGVPQHVGVRLDLQIGAGRGALDQRAKPAVVKGDPRSLTKTKGDVALSRWRRRRARSWLPCIGCVLGVPFLTRRTCSTAPLKSTLSQRESQTSVHKGAMKLFRPKPIGSHAVYWQGETGEP